MTAIGSNIGSSSGAGSRGEPHTYPWISLTLEEQLTNFNRIIYDRWSYIEYFDAAVFKSVARIVKELRTDPWVCIESLPRDEDYDELLLGMTPLHWVVLMGDRMMVRFILTSGKVDINASTRRYKDIALHYAIIGGNLDIVEDLLEHKADVCICNLSGESALYYMVVQKDSMFGILKTILANNVVILDEAKNTTLHHATREGAEDVVRYLLDKYALVNLHNDQFGYTPLHYATERGCEGAVISLLHHHSRGYTRYIANALDDYRWSPLHIVARGGYFNIVTHLVNYEANVNALTKEGFCPLYLAVVGGYLDIVTHLVNHNANVYVWNEDGLCPVDIAVARKRLDIVTCLLEDNANVDALDKDGRSLFLCSVRNGQVDLSKRLIAIGANVHVEDKKKNNALHFAIQGYGRDHNMMDIVKVLQEHNVDANAKNLQGYSPFFAAVVEGHTELVKKLFQNKEKVKLMEECNGQTTIQVAFDYGYEHIKRVLLECDDVSRYVETLYRDRQVYVDAANAILVGAALIASITFASWLQPPLGYTTPYLDLAPSSSDINYVDLQHNVSLRVFWVFNALSFYFAIGTVIFGARSVLPRPRMFIKDIVVKLHQNLLVTSILLACSVFFCHNSLWNSRVYSLDTNIKVSMVHDRSCHLGRLGVFG